MKMNANGNSTALSRCSWSVAVRLAATVTAHPRVFLARARTGALALAIVIAAAPASADPRYEAVEALGALNGVALHCKYLDQVSRMKEAVIDNAPKERSFGLAFDDATNKAFLSMIEQVMACPSKSRFTADVEAAIRDLEQAFARD